MEVVARLHGCGTEAGGGPACRPPRSFLPRNGFKGEAWRFWYLHHGGGMARRELRPTAAAAFSGATWREGDRAHRADRSALPRRGNHGDDYVLRNRCQTQVGQI